MNISNLRSHNPEGHMTSETLMATPTHESIETQIYWLTPNYKEHNYSPLYVEKKSFKVTSSEFISTIFLYDR